MLCRSNYVNSLDASNLQIYESKIEYCSGIDPYQIAFETCETDWNLFPNIQYGDIVNYLVFSTSSATLEEMKAFKSMEAHNFFTSGFVKQEIYLKTVDPEKVLLLGQFQILMMLSGKDAKAVVASLLRKSKQLMLEQRHTGCKMVQEELQKEFVEKTIVSKLTERKE